MKHPQFVTDNEDVKKSIQNIFLHPVLQSEFNLPLQKFNQNFAIVSGYVMC
jgi:hypothetical protein